MRAAGTWREKAHARRARLEAPGYREMPAAILLSPPIIYTEIGTPMPDQRPSLKDTHCYPWSLDSAPVRSTPEVPQFRPRFKAEWLSDDKRIADAHKILRIDWEMYLGPSAGSTEKQDLKRLTWVTFSLALD